MSGVDEATQHVLRDLDAITPLSQGDPDVAVVRKAYNEVFAGWTAPPSRPTNERWLSDCQLGAGYQALVIEPADQTMGETSLVLIHGGGWSLGNALCYAPLGRWLCAQTGMRVLVPDFPQAPESPAPAAYKALTGFLGWVGETYDQDLSLIGDSAGGNLAAVLSNHPPADVTIRMQALLYPVIDLRPDAQYPSRQAFGKGQHFLTTDGIVGAAMQYCGTHLSPEAPMLSPLFETDFSRTPSAVLMIPEFDPLRDECLAYAAKLKEQGVPAHTVIARGTIHGCANFSQRIPSARRALRAVCQCLVAGAIDQTASVTA